MIGILHSEMSLCTIQIRLKMQRIMQEHAAVFRDGPLLQAGCKKVLDVYLNDMPQLKLSDRSMVWNSDLVEALELQNLLLNSLQVGLGILFIGRLSSSPW